MKNYLTLTHPSYPTTHKGSWSLEWVDPHAPLPQVLLGGSPEEPSVQAFLQKNKELFLLRFAGEHQTQIRNLIRIIKKEAKTQQGDEPTKEKESHQKIREILRQVLVETLLDGEGLLALCEQISDRAATEAVRKYKKELREFLGVNP